MKIEGVYEEWSKAINHLGNENKLLLGDVSIESFEVTNNDAMLFNLRNIENPVCYISPNKYIKLIIANNLVMSDTPYERITNQKFVNNAHGNVLIGGLGIGLLIKALLPKLENGEIRHISIWEKNEQLILLWNMARQYLPIHDKISIFNYDVFEYKRMRNQLKGMFDCIYIDIWNHLDKTAYEQMKHFRRVFKPFLNVTNPNAFIECWGREECISRLKRGYWM